MTGASESEKGGAGLLELPGLQFMEALRPPQRKEQLLWPAADTWETALFP